MPTAGACRARWVEEAGKRASSTVRRKARAWSGLGSCTVPSAATRSAAVLPPGQLRRTSVGRRTGSGEGVRVRRVSASGRTPCHETHGRGSAGCGHTPIQPGEPGTAEKALDARYAGWFWKRLDESKVVAPEAPARRSSAESDALTAG